MAKRYFKRKHIANFRSELAKVERKANDLLMRYTYAPWKTERAREYASHGFSRRVSTIRRAILNVFRTVPAGTSRVPSRDKLYDAQINIQACIGNVYGCIDNLAWIWVYEKGLDKKIARNRIGLRKQNKEVRASLSPEFRQYLETRDDWMEYLVDFRDALAHRIPLYIPPGGVPKGRIEEYKEYDRRMHEALMRFETDEYDRLQAEQNKMLSFQPMMTHSFFEAQRLVPFHGQLLSDFLTVEELGYKMLEELKMP